MKDRVPKPASREAEDRAARLAKALRANLHRRKAQARAPERMDDADDNPDQ